MESVLPLGFRDVSHTTVEKILYIADFILEEEAGWLLNRGGFKLALLYSNDTDTLGQKDHEQHSKFIFCPKIKSLCISIE